jgi:GTP-binding protein
MIIRNAEFITSAVETGQYPDWDCPEIAMAGRSNVGKSSLINALCNRKGLARVAAAPGKTRLVNFYRINGDISLVDLAGYGYARVAKATKATWGPMIETYLTTRKQLCLVLLLLDMRHDPSQEDLLMERWLKATGRMYGIVLTKADKLIRQEQASRLEAFRNLLLPGACGIFPVSADKWTGLDDLWQMIADAANRENTASKGR